MRDPAKRNFSLKKKSVTFNVRTVLKNGNKWQRQNQSARPFGRLALVNKVINTNSNYSRKNTQSAL